MIKNLFNLKLIEKSKKNQQQWSSCSSSSNSGALWIHNNAPEIQGNI